MGAMSGVVVKRARGISGWIAALLPKYRRVYGSYSPHLDEINARLTDGLTPARLASIVKAADGGDLAQWLELCAEIEMKDDRVGAVMMKRREAIRAIPWRIVPDDRLKDDSQAQSVAAYCEDYLARIKSFDEVCIPNIIKAIGPGLTVTEKVFKGLRLCEFVEINRSRIFSHYHEKSEGRPVVRIATEEDRYRGVAADSSKFIVAMPGVGGGFPTTNNVMRSIMRPFLFKQMAIKDWASFVERFGMPIPFARVPPSATMEARESLREALGSLASSWPAVIDSTQATEIGFAEAQSRESQPYEAMINAMDRAIAIRVLGENLTTDTTGGTGTYSAADTQNDIRLMIRAADIREEASIVRDQILAQIVRFEFGPNAPIPVFQRSVPEPLNWSTIEVRVRSARLAGLPMSKKNLRSLLQLEEPESPEDTIAPVAMMGGDPFGGGGGVF